MWLLLLDFPWIYGNLLFHFAMIYFHTTPIFFLGKTFVWNVLWKFLCFFFSSLRAFKSFSNVLVGCRGAFRPRKIRLFLLGICVCVYFVYFWVDFPLCSWLWMIICCLTFFKFFFTFTWSFWMLIIPFRMSFEEIAYTFPARIQNFSFFSFSGSWNILLNVMKFVCSLVYPDEDRAHCMNSDRAVTNNKMNIQNI